MNIPLPLSTHASSRPQMSASIEGEDDYNARPDDLPSQQDNTGNPTAAIEPPLVRPPRSVSLGPEAGNWLRNTQRFDTYTTHDPPLPTVRGHFRRRSSVTQPDVELHAYRNMPSRPRRASQPGPERPAIALTTRPSFLDSAQESNPELEPPLWMSNRRFSTFPAVTEHEWKHSRVPSLESSTSSGTLSQTTSAYGPRRKKFRDRQLERVSESRESLIEHGHRGIPAASPNEPSSKPRYHAAEEAPLSAGSRSETEDPRLLALVEALETDPGEAAFMRRGARQPHERNRDSLLVELRTILDAIRAYPQHWSHSRYTDPQSLRARESGITDTERGASPPLEFALTKAEAIDTSVAMDTASAGNKPAMVHDQDAKPRREEDERQGNPNRNRTEDAWPSAQRRDITDYKNDVNLDGPNDPANPSNWPMYKKYATSLVLSLFSFIAPFSATMVGPAFDVIGAELGIAPGAEQQLIMGMQVLGAGIGPFIFAPLIEYYGRVPVIRYGHLWHLIWNTACGFATTGPQLLAFRFIGGIAASSTQILPPGLTADVYPAQMGGLGDSVHNYLPFFGSAVAPIFSAFVTQESNWRWIFWGTSIFSAISIAMAFLFLEETYHPLLLERKAARLRRETGNKYLHTSFQKPGQTTKDWMAKKIALPFLMLVAHPVVQLPFAYRAYLFGIMYLVISIFGRNFMDFYNMDRSSANLNFLALAIGFVVGLHISRYAIDGWSAYFRRKHETDGHMPEWRLPVNAGVALLVPASLILYGWSIESRLHYLISDIAAFFLAIGLIQGFFSLQPYVTESYGLEYASSAHSVGAFLQHIAELAFPLFGPPIYADLDHGWGNTLLAILTLAISILMPLLLWHFGPALRRISTYGLPVEPSARR